MTASWVEAKGSLNANDPPGGGWATHVLSRPEDLRIGIKGIRLLLEGCGILFALPKQQMVTINLSGVTVPVDIVFISNTNEIIKIYRRVQPNPARQYTCFAKYILITQSGETEKELEKYRKVTITPANNLAIVESGIELGVIGAVYYG